MQNVGVFARLALVDEVTPCGKALNPRGDVLRRPAGFGKFAEQPKPFNDLVDHAVCDGQAGPFCPI